MRFNLLFVASFVTGAAVTLVNADWETFNVNLAGHWNSVHFTDAENGTMIGNLETDPVVVRTTDGGDSWADVTPDAATERMWHHDFGSSTTGWIVGFSGTIWKTGDGGATWSAQTSGTTESLNGIDATSATEAWIAGNKGTLLHTTDGGTTWTPVVVIEGTNKDFEIVSFGSAEAGCVFGEDDLVYYTADGGATWTKATRSVSWFGVSYDIDDAIMLNANDGWLCGNSEIDKTSDGGKTWENVENPATFEFGGTVYGPILLALYFVTPDTGWIANHDGSIYITLDGGTTWEEQNQLDSMQVKELCFIDAAHGWGCGNDSLLISTSDGGGGITGSKFSGSRAAGSPGPIIRSLPGLASIAADFHLDDASDVGFRLLTSKGELVAQLAAGQYSSGSHRMNCNLGVLSSGLYSAVLTIDGQRFSRTLTLMK